MTKGLNISTIATVAQHLDNGKIRIEHSTAVLEDGAPDRMVTLSAVVETSAIKSSKTAKGTATYSPPAAHKAGEKPVHTESETNQFTLQLNELKGVKLRNWTLASEIGN